MSTTLDSAHVADLVGQVSGSVLGPHNAGYDAARAADSGLIAEMKAIAIDPDQATATAEGGGLWGN